MFDLVKDTLKKRVLLEIVAKVRERAKDGSLDPLQRIRINGSECYLVDGTGNIFLTLKPSAAM